MKQLILYFMFFVGASLVFVECARMFPTTTGTAEHKTNKGIKFIHFGEGDRNTRNTLNKAGLNRKVNYKTVNNLSGDYTSKTKNYR